MSAPRATYSVAPARSMSGGDVGGERVPVVFDERIRVAPFAATHAVAFTGARTVTRTGSFSRSVIDPPRGDTLDESMTSRPVVARSGRAGGTRTGTTSRALSAPLRAQRLISWRGRRRDGQVAEERYRSAPRGPARR